MTRPRRPEVCHSTLWRALGVAAVVMAGAALAQAPDRGSPDRLLRLEVAANGRFLEREDGAPFFWLGDTAWALFEKAVLEAEADQPDVGFYFRTRAAQGFAGVQTAMVFEAWKNAGGHAPVEDDRATPRVGPDPDDDYWDTVEQIIDRAAAEGLYLAVVPLWMVSRAVDRHDGDAGQAHARFGGGVRGLALARRRDEGAAAAPNLAGRCGAPPTGTYSPAASVIPTGIAASSAGHDRASSSCSAPTFRGPRPSRRLAPSRWPTSGRCCCRVHS